MELLSFQLNYSALPSTAMLAWKAKKVFCGFSHIIHHVPRDTG
jgi:hypothetical protein